MWWCVMTYKELQQLLRIMQDCKSLDVSIPPSPQERDSSLCTLNSMPRQLSRPSPRCDEGMQDKTNEGFKHKC